MLIFSYTYSVEKSTKTIYSMFSLINFMFAHQFCKQCNNNAYPEFDSGSVFQI